MCLASQGRALCTLLPATATEDIQPTMSVLESLGEQGELPRHRTLAAGHDRAQVFSPVQMQTTPFLWHGSVTDITSKYPCFERFTVCSQKER